MNRSSQPIKRTYKKGKLFGKLQGTFIFKPKQKSNANQLALPGFPVKKK
jgi:hypothetical protein